MVRPRLGHFITIVLGSALVVSIGLNGLLFVQSNQYYRELNETRLDPLGLDTFSDANDQVANSDSTKKTVVIFGDSRAAEWPAPVNLSAYLFLNRGIGAQTSAQALGRLDRHVSNLHPKVILVQVCINDLKTIPLFPDRKVEIIARCKNNIKQIVDKSLKAGSMVILTTIFPVGSVPLERMPFWSSDVDAAIDDVNAYIRSLSAPQVAVFDSYSILAPSGRTNLAYFRDTLHINSLGYEALNVGLERLLRTIQ